MSELSKRTTVHFDPSVYEALKTKAEYAHLSISVLIDDAVYKDMGYQLYCHTLIKT